MFNGLNLFEIHMAFDRQLHQFIQDLINGTFWVQLDNISLNELISLKFIWYMTIIKVQAGFEKRGYGSILAGVMAHDRPVNLNSSQYLKCK